MRRHLPIAAVTLPIVFALLACGPGGPPPVPLSSTERDDLARLTSFARGSTAEEIAPFVADARPGPTPLGFAMQEANGTATLLGRELEAQISFDEHGLFQAAYSVEGLEAAEARGFYDRLRAGLAELYGSYDEETARKPIEGRMAGWKEGDIRRGVTLFTVPEEGTAVLVTLQYTGAAPFGSLVATRYSGRFSFDLAAGGLDGRLTVCTPVPLDESAIDFLINRELAIAAIAGDAIGFETEPLAPGHEWDRVTVTLVPDRTEEVVTLDWRYSGVPLMPENGINAIGPDWVELSVDSAWIPIGAGLDRDLVADLLLDLPHDWTFVTSGRTRIDAGRVRLQVEVPHLDIAFVAAPGLSVDGDERMSVAHRGADATTVRQVLRLGARCREHLDERFGGARNLPDVRFAISGRTEGGYARKNFIALTRVDGKTDESLTEFLCHELAHLWSSGAAALTVDNWLNESFAVYVAAEAVREMYGDEAFDALVANWRVRAEGRGSIWREDDLSRRSYEINYKKGPLAILRLEEQIGGTAFDRVLFRYMTDPIDDTPSLLRAIEQEADADARSWFAGVLAADGVP